MELKTLADCVAYIIVYAGGFDDIIQMKKYKKVGLY